MFENLLYTLSTLTIMILDYIKRSLITNLFEILICNMQYAIIIYQVIYFVTNIKYISALKFSNNYLYILFERY